MARARRRAVRSKESVLKGAVRGKGGAPIWRPLFDGRGQLTVSCRPSSSRPWLSLPLSVIPPFIWVYLRECSHHRDSSGAPPEVAAAWHAHPMPALCAPRHLPRLFSLGRARSSFLSAS